MLASHALVLVGVPLQARDARVRAGARRALQPAARLLPRRATSDAEAGARLHAVTPRARQAHAVGQHARRARARRARRAGARGAPPRRASASLAPPRPGALQAGDIVVLLGTPEALAAAEERLLRG